MHVHHCLTRASHGAGGHTPCQLGVIARASVRECCAEPSEPLSGLLVHAVHYCRVLLIAPSIHACSGFVARQHRECTGPARTCPGATCSIDPSIIEARVGQAMLPRRTVRGMIQASD